MISGGAYCTFTPVTLFDEQWIQRCVRGKEKVGIKQKEILNPKSFHLSQMHYNLIWKYLIVILQH